MGRVLVICGLLFGAYVVLSDNRSIRVGGGSGGSGAISGYTGASAPAINGIAGAAG